ncbi:hypothetical protein [Streptomyces sp. NPDC002845]
MTLPRLPVSHVQVVVSDCSAEDAGRLFAALCTQFASDRGAHDEPHETPWDRPTVWTGTFDLSGETGNVPHPEPLTGPVMAEVQGSPLAVRRLRRVLEENFAVHEVGHIAGDQEVEVELRLEAPGTVTPPPDMAG